MWPPFLDQIPTNSWWFICLAVVGVLLLLKIALRLLAMFWRLLWPYVLAPAKDLHRLAGGCRWALVTGCTDGIGRAYVEELAKRGFSLVLVSRTAQKLDRLEAELRSRYPAADFLSIPFDFSESRAEAYRQRLLGRIQHLDIGILVNNVGAMNAFPQTFHEAEGGLDTMADQLTINMYPVTLLSAFILEQMTKRGRGVIVNISSMLAYRPTFNTATYSASKAYMNWLSAALRMDYGAEKGIIIQTICPGVVVTKLSSMVSEGKSANFMMPSPEQFARQAVRTIGHGDELCGHLGHQIQLEFNNLMPGFLVDFMFKQVMLSVRANWLKNHPPAAQAYKTPVLPI